MTLTLTDGERTLLRDVLTDALHELRLEVARTEKKPFRHRLVLRQDFIEQLIAQLEGDASAANA